MSSKSRVAIVTGAARGIGESIALRLSRDGLVVVVSDLPSAQQGADDTVAQIEASGGRASFCPADVSQRDDVVALIDHAVDRFGDVNVIVCNAGIAQIKPVLDITASDLETVFRVNFDSVVWGIQAFTEKVESLGHGGKVIVAASAASMKGFPILGAYSASKFAVRGLIQVAAQELASKGITVNGYAPGIVGTSMWELIDAELSKINGKPIGQNLQESVDRVALGRIETPEDVAKVVSFLASDDSDYVTGQLVIVDGGIVYT